MAEPPIRQAYARYVTGVSHPVHAISLQLAFYLWELVEQRAPRRVADLGSGFSSYVLRLYAQSRDPQLEVWSVDDDPAWLERTRAFLDGDGLPTEGLALWDDFAERDFDLVLHDLGDMETRRATLDAALGLVRPGGLAVLDDLHFSGYREFVTGALERAGVAHEDAQAKTADPIGRYSWLAFPAGQRAAAPAA
jgi:predicted O-methyltransferase YrrM